MSDFRSRADGGRTDDGDRVLVYNPSSGDADRGAEIRGLADEYGFRVRETEVAGDAAEFAAEAVESGATLVAAAGGDGTLNEAVNGVAAADGLDEVTFAVVPAGTGNNFASNVGIEGIAHAFEVIENGERRRIDLARAGSSANADADERSDAGRLFLNSCVGGFTARASAETTAEMKERFGVVAYVLTTLETARDFDPLRLHVRAEGGDRWDGDAVSLLVGNGRRFPADGRTQADMEDGLLDVTIVHDRPATDLAGEAVLQRLFGSETENITRLRSPSLDVDVISGGDVEFSLDGEMLEADRLRIETLPSALTLPVGEAYDPDPDADHGSDSDVAADA